MSETAETPVAAPAKTVKRRRKRRAAPRRQAQIMPSKSPNEFAGMNKLDCCTACRPNGCVISGMDYCAHPMKSGLQPTGDQQVVARYKRAQKVLEHQKLDEKDV